MKKFLLAIILSSVYAFNSYAQVVNEPKPKFEFRIGLSGLSLFSSVFDSNDSDYSDGLLGYSIKDYSYKAVELIYAPETFDSKSFGNITAELSYHLSPALDLSLNLGYNLHWMRYKTYVEPVNGHLYSHTLYAIPYLRWNWVRYKSMKLYSSVGLGAGICFSQKIDIENKNKIITKNIPGIQAEFVPFGISYGKKFFVFGEVGTGIEFMGIKGGAGIRF